jgi:hypothetical protein
LNLPGDGKTTSCRKKRRDVASFAGGLEALTGQTFLICTFIVRCAFLRCVSGAPIRSLSESQGNALAKCHYFQ